MYLCCGIVVLRKAVCVYFFLLPELHALPDAAVGAGLAHVVRGPVPAVAAAAAAHVVVHGGRRVRAGDAAGVALAQVVAGVAQVAGEGL